MLISHLLPMGYFWYPVGTEGKNVMIRSDFAVHLEHRVKGDCKMHPRSYAMQMERRFDPLYGACRPAMSQPSLLYCLAYNATAADPLCGSVQCMQIPYTKRRMAERGSS